MKRLLISTLLILYLFSPGFTQVVSEDNPIRIYSNPMDPRQHPDDSRRAIKPPDARVFDNQIQFMALRSLEGDYRSLMDKYVVKYGLGKIIWPSYPVIYRKDLPEVVQEIKKRDLYVFDIWGYVPGSGPGGYWQQFTIPEKTLGLFEQQLGDHWLGMDNGEQDGRYIGGYASQMNPEGACREKQYLNFQNHFQGLTDRLGNRLATLVSLNFGHYFLKEGVYTLIGAETAQGLPNTQIYYSFIRGAGKQYGVPWFGNASVWNRWGWKNYEGVSDYNGGPTKGTSLSLLKRLIYSHILYNCVAVGFEASFFNGKGELSPVGRIQQSAGHWVKENGSPGTLYTPVAVMTDFFAGWTFPRHLYSENIYRVWGNLPYDEGDYLTDGILDMLYPGYQDASYFHDETGFITPTPYGDAADCILSDCPLWLLQQYPVLIIGGKLSGGNEIRQKLEKYVQSGGHLIITAGNLESMPEGLLDVKTLPALSQVNEGAVVEYQNTRFTEPANFQIKELSYPEHAKPIAFCDQKPIAVELSCGPGKMTVFASAFGILSKPANAIPVKSETDRKLQTPLPLLNHVKAICGDIFAATQIFQTNKELSLITCRKSKGVYTLALSNNSWQEKPFTIVSNAGKILNIRELPIDCSEKNAEGHLPENVVNRTGKNTPHTISGGDVRIFSVQIEEKNIEEIPFIHPLPNPQNRGINLRNVLSVKEEILLRPTFFQHFDRVMIDWKYLYQRENSILSAESGWIKRQGLKVLVDLSSGINLFPDLRVVNNDSAEYVRSMNIIRSVIDKMSLLGAGDLIMTAHRTIENNFTAEQFTESLKNTFKELCQYAAKLDINIHLRLTLDKNPVSFEKATELIKSVDEPNFYIAPSIALLRGDSTGSFKIPDPVVNLKYAILLISAGEKDLQGKLWNLNLPLYKSGNKEAIQDMLLLAPGKTLLLDAVYQNKEEEFLDVQILDEAQKQPVDYVRPNLGSYHARWFFYTPAALPFGMAKLAPHTNAYGSPGGWFPCGYSDSQNSIEGFGHFHEFQIGGLVVMPTTGKLQTVPGSLEKPDEGYRSRFDKKDEHAEPGYYSVMLKDYNIKAELTATSRTGFHRYTFPASDESHLIFDIGHRQGESGEVTEAMARWDKKNHIEGYVITYPEYAKFCDPGNKVKMYFFAQLSKVPESAGSFINDTIFPAHAETKGVNNGLYLNFKTRKGEIIEMQAGLSYTSIDNARKNLEAEAGEMTFDRVRMAARKQWNDLLGRLKVTGGKETDKVKFYTGLYHALLGRGLSSDINGQYPLNKGGIGQLPLDKDGRPVRNHYNTDGIWGGCWNLGPLWALAYPEYFSGYMQSNIDFYTETGWLHDGEAAGVYTNGVQTNFMGLMMAAAYNCGIRDFDVKKGYEAALKNELTFEGRNLGNGKYDLEYFIKQGYVPNYEYKLANGWVFIFGASHTLEYCFNSYAVGQFAKALGKTGDYLKLSKLAGNYRLLYNPETRFIQPREKDGTFIKNFNEMTAWKGFQEGNAFQYTWYVPHDVNGLIELLGKDLFNQRLEMVFTESEKTGFGGGKEIASFSGVEKLYNHGNQPCLHNAWLFNYSGKPWLTQKWTRAICNEFYGIEAIDGYGYGQDEDEGQIGAWYVLASMGLFDVQGHTAERPTFQLGSPLFDKIEIQLNPRYYPGRSIIIETTHNTAGNCYIQSALLNGKNLENCWFYRDELMKGGKLVLQMGPEPNFKWGINKVPPSMSNE